MKLNFKQTQAVPTATSRVLSININDSTKQAISDVYNDSIFRKFGINMKDSENKPKQTKKVKSRSITPNDIFAFIDQQYGGDVNKVMGTISTVLSVGVTTGFIKNPKIKKAISTTQGLLGAAMFGYDFYHRLNSYIQSQQMSVEISDGRHEFIQSRLGKTYSTSDFLTSKNIILWIVNKPETSEVKILKYYDFSKFEEVSTIEDTLTDIGILLRFPDERLAIWNLKIMKMGDFVTCRDSDLHISGICPDEEQFLNYQMYMNKEYVSSLEIDKNTLRFNGHGTFMGLEPIPRKVVTTQIYNFDFDEFIKEVETILDCKRRRGYAFVGQPGVGKSSIIRKVESAITKYPMVYFSASEFDNSDTLRNSFQMLKSIGPCVIVIEDLDSYGLGTKNYIASTFLECIDEVNEDTTMVLLVTINETNLIHDSIINRPGRCDRIIEVTTPQSTQEIVNIMNYKINKLKDEYFDGTLPYVMKDGNALIQQCLERKYTQAELVNALVEEVILKIKTSCTELPVSDDCFYFEMDKAMNNLEKSKEASKRYGE